MKINIVTGIDPQLLLRQLPPTLKNVEFTFNSEEANDVTIVYDSPTNPQTKIKSKAIVFIASEPPNVLKYSEKFMSQFTYVLSADTTISDVQYRRHAFLPWHYGAFSSPLLCYEDLLTEKTAVKERTACVFCSNKVFTPEHKKRFEFVQLLQEQLGDRIDFYGRGLDEFNDKSDLLHKYKYHLALENCDFKDYWTEKIADSYLAESYPIYWGCQNLEDYFDVESFSRININEPVKAIETIKEIIDSDLFIKKRDKILESKMKVLNDYNFFNEIQRIAFEVIKENQSCEYKEATIYSNNFSNSENTLKQRLKDSLRRFSPLYKAACKVKDLKLLIIFYKFIWTRKLQHHYNLTCNKRYKAHHLWLKTSGENLKYEFDLDSNSIVFDVGGYHGDWAKKIQQNYNPHLHIFEPYLKFVDIISENVEKNSRTHIIASALSSKNSTFNLYLNDDNTSSFPVNSECIQANSIAIMDYLRLQQIQKVDLIKLNIEGEEYEVLDQVIKEKVIQDFNYILIQFHIFDESHKIKYERIQKELKKTHHLQWQYYLTWELWKLKL